MVAIPCGGYSPRGDFPWGNFVEATSLEPFSCSIPLSVHMFDLLKKKKNISESLLLRGGLTNVHGKEACLLNRQGRGEIERSYSTFQS